ncbi:MAG: hypothetical protein ACLSBB_14405 [Ruthenibacterium lactatiformans]
MILLLYSPATYEYADVIGTYLYRYGLVGGNFSYGTAVGLFISLINFGLMFWRTSLTQGRRLFVVVIYFTKKG